MQEQRATYACLPPAAFLFFFLYYFVHISVLFLTKERASRALSTRPPPRERRMTNYDRWVSFVDKQTHNMRSRRRGPAPAARLVAQSLATGEGEGNAAVESALYARRSLPERDSVSARERRPLSGTEARDDVRPYAAYCAGQRPEAKLMYGQQGRSFATAWAPLQRETTAVEKELASGQRLPQWIDPGRSARRARSHFVALLRRANGRQLCNHFPVQHPSPSPRLALRVL